MALGWMGCEQPGLWEESLPKAEGWDWMISKVSANPNCAFVPLFYIFFDFGSLLLDCKLPSHL